MPDIQFFKDVTVPVVLQCGAAKITFDVLVLKVSCTDTGYKKLLDRYNELQGEIANCNAQIEKAVASLSDLNDPGQPAYLQLRRDLEPHFETVAAGINLKDFEAAGNALTSMLETFTALDASLIPNEKQVKERNQVATHKMKGLTEKIEKIARDDIPRNIAERICYLCKDWDMTEGEGPDAPRWPLTVDNLLSISPLLHLAIEAIEAEVFGRHLTEAA